MNANFTAVESAVDDNHSRITSLESASGSTQRVIFKGFSSSTGIGSIGVIGLANMCESSFSGSRVCTTTEFFTADMSTATGLVGRAWIHHDPVQYDSLTLDRMSQQGIGSCGGWGYTNSGYYGLSTSATGQIETIACSNSLAAACCE